MSMLNNIGTRAAQLSQSIEWIQNYAMRTILKKPPRTPSAPLRERLNWTTLHQRRHKFMLYQVHRCVTKQAPPYLAKKFKKNSTFYSHTRGAEKLHLSRPSSEYYRQSFEFQGALNYNKLPIDIRQIPTLLSFKTALTNL